MADTRSAGPCPVNVMFVGSNPSICGTTWRYSRQRSKVVQLTGLGKALMLSIGTSPSRTRDSGSAKGGGVKTTASTSAKRAVPAPNVSASVRTAAAALVGDLRMTRLKWRSSINIKATG